MGRRKRLLRETMVVVRREKEIADTAKRIANDLYTNERRRQEPGRVAILSLAADAAGIGSKGGE